MHEWGIQITDILIQKVELKGELQEQFSVVAKEQRLAGMIFNYFRCKSFKRTS